MVITGLTLEDLLIWAEPEPNSGCWLWLRARFHYGHGAIKLGGQQLRAHRVAYVLAFGPIADDVDVLHRCDCPPCIWPWHLFTGDQVINNADRDAKGRAAFGVRQWCAKITPSIAIEIRGRGRLGESTASIARSVGLSWPAVDRILKGRNWKQAGAKDLGW